MAIILIFWVSSTTYLLAHNIRYMICTNISLSCSFRTSRLWINLGIRGLWAHSESYFILPKPSSSYCQWPFPPSFINQTLLRLWVCAIINDCHSHCDLADGAQQVIVFYGRLSDLGFWDITYSRLWVAWNGLAPRYDTDTNIILWYDYRSARLYNERDKCCILSISYWSEPSYACKYVF